MYNAYGLTDAEIELLITIADKTRDNIIETYKAAGLKAIHDNLTLDEVYEQEMLDMMSEFNALSDRFTHAIVQTEYLKLILGPLSRAFGDDAIFGLLPDEARTEEAVELYYKYGDFALANLCGEAIQRMDHEEKPEGYADPEGKHFKNKPQ